MIFEDAHWSDPSSQDVLNLAIQRLASHRVLLMVTFRPEFVPAWAGSHMAIALARLPVEDVGSMIDRVAGANALPDRCGRRSSSAPTAFRFSWRK